MPASHSEDCKVFHTPPPPSPSPYGLCCLSSPLWKGGGVGVLVLPGIKRQGLAEICATDNASRSLSRALPWAICRVAQKKEQNVINIWPIDMPIDNRSSQEMYRQLKNCIVMVIIDKRSTFSLIELDRISFL